MASHGGLKSIGNTSLVMYRLTTRVRNPLVGQPIHLPPSDSGADNVTDGKGARETRRKRRR